MNNVSLVGRLTKDPELRYTANNVPVAGFTLAVNRRFKQDGQSEADFVPIVAWQSTAEFCDKYFRKGQQVWVCGRIQTRSWDDADGKRHYVTEVVAEQVGFADSKKDDDSNQSAAPQSGRQGSATAATRPASPPPQAPAAKDTGGRMPWEVT